MIRRIAVLASVLAVAGLMAPGAVQAASGVFSSSTATSAVKATNTSSAAGAKAVEATASASTTNLTYGVTGTSKSTTGYGVFGQNLAASGNAWGVYGRTFSASGKGVEGHALSTSGVHYGVLGSAQGSGTGVSGVYGLALSGTGITNGVLGRSNSPDGNGLYGIDLAPGGWGAVGEGDSLGVVGFGGAIGVGGTSGSFANGTYGVQSATDLGVSGHLVGTTGDLAGVCTVAAGQTASLQCSFTHKFPAAKGKPIIILTPRGANPNAFHWVHNVADGAGNWVGFRVNLSAAQGSAKEFNWVVVGVDPAIAPAAVAAASTSRLARYLNYEK